MTTTMTAITVLLTILDKLPLVKRIILFITYIQVISLVPTFFGTIEIANVYLNLI
jgi:hypothetical protein